MELFSLKLRRLIEQLDLTIEAFAKQNDVTPQTVYNMLSGRKPSINFIISLITNYPNVDLNWLLKDTDQDLEPKTTIVDEQRTEYINFLRRNLERLEALVNPPIKKSSK